MTHFTQAILAALVLLLQVCFVPGLDISEVGRFLVVAVGCIGLAACFTAYRFNVSDVVIAMPFLAVIGVSLLNFVPGHTVYSIATYSGMLGITLLAARTNGKAVAWALMASVLIQLWFRRNQVIPWSMNGLTDLNSLWGSFRHRIRYATITYAGLIGCWHVWRTTENKAAKCVSLIIGGIALGSIAWSESRTPLFLAGLAAVMWLGQWKGSRVGKYALVSFLTASVLLVALEIPKRGLFHGRLEMWSGAFQAITDSWEHILAGRGADSWQLYAGALGFEGLGHPHSSLLNMAFDFGIPVTVFAISWVFTSSLFGIRNLPIFMGFAGLSLSTLTNSYRYPEIWLLISIFAGLCLSETHRICYESACGDSGSVQPIG